MITYQKNFFVSVKYLINFYLNLYTTVFYHKNKFNNIDNFEQLLNTARSSYTTLDEAVCLKMYNTRIIFNIYNLLILEIREFRNLKVLKFTYLILHARK